MMTRNFTLLFFILGLFFLQSTLSGQMIWPGDVSNNGRVDGIDVLYLGSAFQSTGAPRANASSEWEGQPMPPAWSNAFPAGQNFAYADADGNGTVEQADLDNPLEDNFGKEHGTVVDDEFEDVPPNYAFLITPVTETQEAEPGQEVEVYIRLGLADRPVYDLSGLSFELVFPEGLILPGSFDGEFIANTWLDDFEDANDIELVHFDEARATATFAYARVDNQMSNGASGIAKMKFFIDPAAGEHINGDFLIELDAVTILNNQMQRHLITANNWSMTLVGGSTGGGPVVNPGTPTSCPNTVAPVCAANGVTYLNSCYAEQAGQTEYTSGVCYSDCIDPNAMNPNATCTQVYEPVCGCNNVTYLNECVANANGVTTVMAGPCNATTFGCYDPYLVVSATGTTVNSNTGVVSLNCTNSWAPVCGCDGITYANACIAEASGITFYTQGECGNVCVDPWNMNPDANCPQNYNPVCGCNGVTYSNPCVADAAGVLNYTPGICGQTTNSWCTNAAPVACGDFLYNESTVGQSNKISSYPGCSNYSYPAPDKVYVINKTTAGDLQIGLEILTPGLNLDMFLLDGNCSQVTCLGKSTTSNTQTNNEGIVLEDAPIGTYYLVIDGRQANYVGSFNLEVNCGYLDCSAAVQLTCGTPYNGNNTYGDDNVSLYTCGNTVNVENNGPEVVHTFTLTAPGLVDINLVGLSANLELFLLGACDRGECVKYSQNPGTQNENINMYLNAGTYYVVVDGYNGAVSDYTLTIDCAESCGMSLSNSASTPAGCGSSNGSITISSWGGTPGYLVHYNGPVSGSFSTYANTCTVSNLPPGTYQITKTDYYGCTATTTVVVHSSGNLNMWATPHDAMCGMSGYIQVALSGGQAPYQVQVSGPTSGSMTTNSTNFNLTSLGAGVYTVYITDASGCTASKTVTIGSATSNFSYVAAPVAASCNAPGAIKVQTSGGVPIYNILLQGPVSGSASTHNSNFTLVNLPAGTYVLRVEDGNWCTQEQTIVVPGGNIDLVATPTNGACNQYGSVQVTASWGTGPYTINWNGPVSGQTTSATGNYTIPNLPTGSYTITVEDANNCSANTTVYVNNSGGNLNANIMPINGTCGATGALWIDIYNGSPNYVISWTGAASGSTTTNSNAFDIPNLPGGQYTVTITDANGCTYTQVVYLNSAGNIGVLATPANGNCNQAGSIGVSVTGGTPSFVVSWTGPANGSQNIAGYTYNIGSLPSGYYTIQVTDANGCNSTTYATVNNADTGLDATVNPLAGNCTDLGAVVVSISSGSGPYSVNWNGPVSGSLTSNSNIVNLPNLPDGSYTINVTDNGGCSTTESTTVSTPDNGMEVQLAPVNNGCGNLSQIWVDIIGGAPIYTVMWTGPVNGSFNTSSANFEIPNLPDGTYTVKITDVNGCMDTGTVTVFSGDMYIQVSAVPGLCGQNGSIDLDITGGTGPFDVSYVGPVSGSFTTSTSDLTLPNIPDGTYSVTVNDASGCTDTETIVVTSPGNDLNVVGTPINGACGQNGSLWIDITGGTTPYVVQWTGPVSGTANTNNDNYDVPDVPSGTYTVKITDANGCMVTTTITIVNTGSDISLGATAINGDCGENGQINLSVGGGTAPYTITWTGPSSGSQSGVINNASITDLVSGAYTIGANDANGCSTSQVVIIANAEDDVSAQLLPIAGNCDAEGSLQVNISGGAAGYTVSWTGPESGSTATNGNSVTIPNLASGTYNVLVTDANGCNSSNSATLSNPENDLVLTATPSNGTCGQLGSIMIAIGGGSAPYNVSWSGPVNGSSASNGNFFINNLSNGTYSIVVTDANGCSETTSAAINNGVGGPVISATATPGACGQAGSITVQISGGAPDYNISWSGPESGSTSASGTTTLGGLTNSGVYTIFVSDANNCTVSTSVALNNNANPLNATASVNNGQCGQLGIVTVSIFGGSPSYTISWNGPISGSSTTAGNTISIPNLTTGSYTINITDSNGCTTATTANVNNPSNNLSVGTTITDQQCNSLGNIQVSVSGGTNPYSISWNGPSSGAVTVANSVYNIANAVAGTYSINVTDGSGCTQTVSATVGSNSGNLSLNSTPVDATCLNNGYLWLDFFNGTGPYSISWSGPSSGTTSNIATASYTIPDLSPGLYNVTLTDASGCTATATSVINGQDSDVDCTLVPTPGDCGNVGEIKVTISGGSPSYSVNYSGPVSGTVSASGNMVTIPGLPTGSYTIIVTDANGCSHTANTFLNNGNAGGITVDVTPVHGSCGSLGSIWIDFINGGPNACYNLTWSGPVSGSQLVCMDFYDIPDLPSGTYTLTVTYEGCLYTYTTTVTNAPDDLLVSVVPVNAPCGQPGSIQVDITGSNPPFTVSWSGPNSMGGQTISGNSFTITQVPSGTFVIGVADANGCVEQHTVNVFTQGNTLDMTLIPNSAGCNGGLGSIQVTPSGGTPPYEATYSGASGGVVASSNSTFAIPNLPAGNYTVVLEDGNGCLSTETTLVGSVSAAPGVLFSWSDDLGTLTFTNQSAGGTSYLWDFGDGNTSTEITPVHTYDMIGTYTVCLTATNDCGSTTACQDVTVNFAGNAVILDVEEGIAATGNTIFLPVTIANCPALASISGSINIADPSVATITGINPAAINPTFNANNNSFNYYDNSGQGIPLNQNEVLFYLVIDVTGAPGATTEVTIAASPVPIEVACMINGSPVISPYISLPGSVTVAFVSQIAGAVNTYWGEGIKNVEVSAVSAQYTDMQMTDENGQYDHPEVPSGETYIIEAKKDTDPANGLSTYSLFIGQRFILGYDPPQITSPYQVIAGDANCSGGFTTLDLFLIQQLIIGVNDEFAHCPSWVFVAEGSNMPADFNAYNVFPYNDSDTMMVMQDEQVDFVGVKVGDILGQAEPDQLTGNNGPLVDDRNALELRLTAKNQSADAGTTIEIPVTSANFDAIVSYQMGLQYDTDKLTYLGVDVPAQGALNSLAYGHANDMENELRFSWFNLGGGAVSTTKETTLFTLRFRAEADIESLDGLFEVNSRHLRSVAHRDNAEAMEIGLYFVEDIIITDDVAFRLYQNEPNPMGDRTVIGFDLPEAMPATLVITDKLGREIKQIEVNGVAGYNQVNLKRADMSVGVYYYTLRTRDFTATKSLLISQ